MPFEVARYPSCRDVDRRADQSNRGTFRAGPSSRSRNWDALRATERPRATNVPVHYLSKVLRRPVAAVLRSQKGMAVIARRDLRIGFAYRRASGRGSTGERSLPSVGQLRRDLPVIAPCVVEAERRAVAGRTKARSGTCGSVAKIGRVRRGASTPATSPALRRVPACHHANRRLE
jgi:hypothetical protein